MKRWLIAIIVLALFHPFHSHAGSKIVFSGIPQIKVSEGGVSRVSKDLPRNKAVDLGCVISEIDGKYYWATRKNKELVKHESINFLTYVAIDGSGYIRFIRKEKKGIVSWLDATEAKFDYIEHMLLGLKSITYFGVRE